MNAHMSNRLDETDDKLFRNINCDAIDARMEVGASYNFAALNLDHSVLSAPDDDFDMDESVALP